MTAQAALLMAPLLLRIRTGEENMGWEYGGVQGGWFGVGFKGGQVLLPPCPAPKTISGSFFNKSDVAMMSLIGWLNSQVASKALRCHGNYPGV